MTSAVNRKIAVALSTLWISRAATLSLNLVLVPILFRRLPPSELGTWLLLSQLGTVVVFFDFGMTSVLARQIAIVSARDASDPARGRELHELVSAARLLFRCVSLAALAVALAGGWLFLGWLGLAGDALRVARMTWVVLCLGYAVNLNGGLWWALLWGFGRIARGTAILTTSAVITTLVLIAAAALGGGMEALACILLVSALAQQIAMKRAARRGDPILQQPPTRASRAVLKSIAVPSSRYWLTQVGAVVLLRTDQFFIAGFQEPARIPAYYACYTLIYNLALVSMNIGDASFVFVSKLWREEDPSAVHALVLRSARIGMALMLSGVAVMLSLGDAVLTVWLGPGRFVGWPVLVTFCAMLVLFVQQSLLLEYSRATENEAYAPCYLIAGVLNLLFTWALIRPLDLLGCALGTLLAQMLTTNWFIPRSALRRLRIPVRRYAEQVLLPGGAVFGTVYLAVWSATRAIPAERALDRVAVGAVAGGVALALCFWAVVLEPGVRVHVRREAGLLAQRLRAYAR